MKKIFAAVLSFPILLFLSCTACSLPLGDNNGPSELTVLSWNVQNIFDDVADGSEYDEFNPDKSEWNSNLFYKRLNRIEEMLNVTLDDFPQIFLLQEVENLNALNILNQEILNGHFDWQILLEVDESSVHTAVLSEIPITSVSTLETGYYGLYKLRPITEIHFDLGGKELVLFNNHWKSKSGGSAATESGRIQSAAVLVERIAKLLSEDADRLIIAAGDFNENHDEYKKTGRNYQTALMTEIESVPDEWTDSLYITSKGRNCSYADGKLTLYSPWYDVSSSGSYAYKSQWSKIDHFFLWKTLFDGTGYEYGSFELVKDSLLLNDYNYPARWDTLTEEGYSDHLPVLLKLLNNDL